MGGQRGYWDPREGMRAVLRAQLEAFAQAKTAQDRAHAMNVLVAEAAPWLRADAAYAEELERIEEQVKEQGLGVWEGRYLMLAAVVCSLARQGMLDTMATPEDTLTAPAPAPAPVGPLLRQEPEGPGEPEEDVPADELHA